VLSEAFKLHEAYLFLKNRLLWIWSSMISDVHIIDPCFHSVWEILKRTTISFNSTIQYGSCTIRYYSAGPGIAEIINVYIQTV
jgi:hypothetical protein